LAPLAGDRRRARGASGRRIDRDCRFARWSGMVDAADPIDVAARHDPSGRFRPVNY
jgi:hypothetical protein